MLQQNNERTKVSKVLREEGSSIVEVPGDMPPTRYTFSDF